MRVMLTLGHATGHTERPGRTTIGSLGRVRRVTEHVRMVTLQVTVVLEHVRSRYGHTVRLGVHSVTHEVFWITLSGWKEALLSGSLVLSSSMSGVTSGHVFVARHMRRRCR